MRERKEEDYMVRCHGIHSQIKLIGYTFNIFSLYFNVS